MKRGLWRTGIGLAAVVGLLAAAAPAAAHVTVDPREAAAGSYARVDFRVPNERDATATTKLEVHLPTDTPIPSVSVKPVPGWEVEVTRRTLDEPIEGGHGEVIEEVVESITWSAQSEEAAIQPGQFGEFPVSMGPLPEGVDALYFPSLQTYSDDEVVRWIDVAAEGVEADRPAPVLRVTAGSGHGSEPAQSEEPASDDPDGTSEAAGSAEADTPGWLVAVAVIGLVAAVGALALAGAALARARR